MDKNVMYIADNKVNICTATTSVLEKDGFNVVSLNNDRMITIANIILKLDSKQAIINNMDIGLTIMEFNLLSYLAKNRSRAVGRDELLRRIWGFESIVETRATDDMIKRIRKKLVKANSTLKITTVWGFGFKIEACV